MNSLVHVAVYWIMYEEEKFNTRNVYTKLDHPPRGNGITPFISTCTAIVQSGSILMNFNSVSEVQQFEEGWDK